MNIAYGIYITDDYSKKQIYNSVLSIKSAFKYLKNIDNVWIYTNNDDSVSFVLNIFLDDNEKKKLNIIKTTEFVDSLNEICLKGSNHYLTAGIFYRLQIFSELQDVLYVDNDVIFYSSKFKLPTKKGLNKTDFDSSCICYSKDGLEKKDILYYVIYHKKHVASLEYPDECIIHDGFGYLEHKYHYEGAMHFGNSECFEHNEYNEKLFLSLLEVIKKQNPRKELDYNVFDSYFRKPRSTFMNKKVKEA